MRIGVSLPPDLVTFIDEAAKRRGTSRSDLLAELLEAEKVRHQMSAYLDRHSWDIAHEEGAWREYQRARMAADYGDDDW